MLPINLPFESEGFRDSARSICIIGSCKRKDGLVEPERWQRATALFPCLSILSLFVVQAFFGFRGHPLSQAYAGRRGSLFIS